MRAPMPETDRRPRNLVFCRVGDGSLHRSWMGDPATRSYDVWLDYYGADDARYAGDPARLTVTRDLFKIQRIAQIVRDHRDALAGYDAIWFPDDDLQATPETVDRLFEIFHALDLLVAQPALADGSHYSHAITLENREFSVRFTNYVEPMAPVFSRPALEACWMTFAESISGWGIDYVWPKLLGEPRDRLAIVDAASVLHTRPVGVSAWYRSLKLDPMAELVATAARHGVALPHRKVHYRGLPRGTVDRAAMIPLGFAFAARVVRGAPPRVRYVRRYWDRQLQALYHGWRHLRRRNLPSDARDAIREGAP
jgi:hypothetical protein